MHNESRFKANGRGRLHFDRTARGHRHIGGDVVAGFKTKAQGIACLNNGKQMMLAWRLYVEDNQDRVPQSFGPRQWVNGDLNFDGGNSSNWDVERDILNVPSPNNEDMFWLMDRTTRKR